MPNTPTDIHPARTDRSRAARESEGPATILLVEDDDDSREMMTEYLHSLGFRVEEAATGPEALARALALRPSIVLLDMTLPGLGGLDVALSLRADASTRDIPIVALSGREIRKEDRAAFDGVVTKPADLDHLHTLVTALLAGRRRPTP